jgi:hypothetical protein
VVGANYTTLESEFSSRIERFGNHKKSCQNVINKNENTKSASFVLSFWKGYLVFVLRSKTKKVKQKK